MRNMRIWMALVALVAACAAYAQSGQHNRYKWRDAQGGLHFDDVLPPEALLVGYDIVNPQGLVVKHVDRVKTAEEMKADQAAAEKVAAEKRSAEEQVRNDEQMLAAYPNEEELAASLHAQLDMIEQNIRSTEISLQSQEKSLTEMLSHAADLDRSGKPVPDTLKQQIETLRVNIEKQKSYIASKEQEKTESAKRFDAELAHYRDVQAKAKGQH